MKVRLGTLRLFLVEVIEEQGWVPGRWSPGDGEPVRPDDIERIGDSELSIDMDETDERMVGDGKGDANGGDDEMASHLRSEEEGTNLGGVDDETMREHALLRNEMKRYFLQEGPAGAGMVSPVEPKGAYSPFDMTKDHTGTDDLSATWYRSPGREAGTEGDPFRGEDPHAQLGFHPPAGKDSTAHPAVNGEEGVAARRAPPIWQLSAGSDTSKVLGANAKPDSGGVDSDGESEEGEEGTEGGAPGEEGDEAEGEEQD